MSKNYFIGNGAEAQYSMRYGAVDIHAMIFFSRILSDAEIARVHEAMLLL